MNTSTRIAKLPLIFFLLVFALSLPFWVLGALIDGFLPKELPINLPLSSLMVFNP